MKNLCSHPLQRVRGSVLNVFDKSEAARRGDIIFLALSDTQMPAIYAEQIVPGLRSGQRCFSRMDLQFITAPLSLVKTSMLSWSPRKVWNRWCAGNLSEDVVRPD